jgi:predicted transcriptional regulator
MKNWNSKLNEYTPIKKERTKQKARKAIDLYNKGEHVNVIAAELGVSAPRVYQYLRKDD